MGAKDASVSGRAGHERAQGRKNRGFGAYARLEQGRAWPVFSLLMGGLCASGCLILDPIEFDDRQIPAHLDQLDPFTFTRVPDQPDPFCLGTPGDAMEGMVFSVRVSDANTSEPLEGRLIVNGGPSNNFVYNFHIPATGSYDRGPQRVCAALDRLNATCNRVELLVTSDWSNSFPYGTTDPNDVARVEWWVLGSVRDTPNADPNDCAKYMESELP
jgi:hypothetical protein